MREQGTLVAPRLWAEKDVGRANLNNHEKPRVLSLRWRRDHPDPGPTLRGGVGKTEKNGKNRPASRPKARNPTNKPRTRTPNLITREKNGKLLRSGGGLKVK